MKNKLATILLLLVFSLVLLGMGTEVRADVGEPVKCDPDYFKPLGPTCIPIDTGLSEKSIAEITVNFMKWLLGIFGFIAIIAFVISGVQYLVSAGEEKAIETAKRNMKWAIVGVIVALSGYVIVQAISMALEATSTKF